MNYYERIQKSIDYIERNLENKIDLNLVAKEAYMSQSNYYRLFFAIVGHSIKEYIRLRRISFAAFDIRSSNVCIIDIAVKYDFNSGDTFSRAFKRITGFLPSDFREQNQIYSFERMNVMDKYFDVQDKKLLEKYPDIKVLKKLETMRVAYYCYYGKHSEDNAFTVMREWINKTGMNINEQKLRIWGFDNPSPSEGHDEYGYEVCITIDEDIDVNDDKIKTKFLDGGLYAVIGVKPDENGEIGYEIMKAWKRFNNWLTDSKYIYGGHQWLEEHLGFDDNFNHIGGVDLYMPIMEKNNIDMIKTFENVEPMWTATYMVTGKDAIDKGRDYFLKWAASEGLFSDNLNNRFFAYYNYERIGHDDFFFKIHTTVDKEFKTDNPNIKLEEFKGGYYAVMKSKYKYNGWALGEFMNWMSKSKEYCIGDYWFFEEYKINDPHIEMETDMILYMPIKVKV
ncbi:hypothetical protein psyc5s11_28560 [Clostridium gelidum]|uniref:HTH araC/xylS-type domain-containing protein n=1 Tax=Clostridium gelidum TaxID=704125 RepID=A0ABM7T4B5_9CLOT|nr:helix-turn-helix domain-containing protein [Clostridium gelidum]BCZ46789.1 hypothetical protein psyc5s11_28560 [Clostridium gelidum]